MKKICSLLIIVVLFFASKEALAQQLTPPQQQAVNKLFKTSKVVYFKFNVRSLSEIPQFGRMFSVDKSQGAVVYAHADKGQFSQFIRTNYKYAVLPTPGGKKKTTKSAAKKAPVKKK